MHHYRIHLEDGTIEVVESPVPWQRDDERIWFSDAEDPDGAARCWSGRRAEFPRAQVVIISRLDYADSTAGPTTPHEIGIR
jgi:hypothetical protein